MVLSGIVWRKYWWIFPFILFLGVFFRLLNFHFPIIGGDYDYILHRLLVGNWHIFHQGLGPFYYSSYVCGGSITYGSPNDAFYSLMQFSSYFIDYWQAINLSVLVNLIIGYAGWFLVGCHVLRLKSKWSHLLSLLVLTNGFYLVHVAGGHFNFISFPVLGWLFWCVFDRRLDSWISLLFRVSIFSLVTGWALYSAGYYVLLFWLMAAIAFVPLDLLVLRRVVLKRLLMLLWRVAGCGLGALAIGASKLVAVYSYMSVYPRTYSVWPALPIEQVPSFIYQTFFNYPVSSSSISPLPHSLVEASFLLSPVVLIGLAVGFVLLIRALLKNNWNGLVVVMGTIYVFAVVHFFLELTSGFGWSVNLLDRLPVFASIRMYIRFLYIPSLLLIVLAVWSLARMTERHLKDYVNIIVVLAAASTVMFFYWGYTGGIKVNPGAFGIGYAYNVHEELMSNLQLSGGLPELVREIGPGGSDYVGVSGLGCYDAVLVWAGPSALHRQALHVGPVADQSDGYYNIMKPACITYPEANDCKPGDRIPVSDQENFERFISGKKVSWKVSGWQTFANYLSLIWLIVSVLVLVIMGTIVVISRVIVKTRRNEK